MNSIWEDFRENIDLKKLDKNLKADVCIIGAGITGLNLAYLLIKNGYNVILLDKENICNNVTSKCTGKITSQHGLIYTKLIKEQGIKFAKQYFYMQEKAIKLYEYIIKKEKIKCDFKKVSAFLFTNKEKYKYKLQEEFKSYIKINGNVKFKRNIKLPFKCKYALELINQGEFNPVKYMNSLVKIILKNKGRIFIKSKVIKIRKGIFNYSVYTKENVIKSKYVVIATNYPTIKKLDGNYFTKLYKNISYASAIEIEKDDLKNGIYIDIEKEGYSYRVAKDFNNNLNLIVIGNEHKTGKETDKNYYNKIKEHINKMYPNKEIKYKWCTEDSVSIDKLPYIGNISFLNKRVCISSGYSNWGITNSMIAAKKIEKYIVNNNLIEKELKSTRFNYLKNKKETISMLKDFVNYRILEKISIRKAVLKEIAKEEAIIIKRKGKIIVIYKDKEENLHAVVPICTHLKCLLNFNNTEKTWDCPCHGSRYDFDGKIIYGPGQKNLKKIIIE